MAWFENDPGAVNVRGGILGPMTGSQKAAMLFAGLRDAVGNFSGRPTENLNQLADQYGQMNYRQQVRQDRLGEKEAEAKRYEQGRSDKMMRPASVEEKTAAGLDPKTPALVDAFGKLAPITDPNQISAYQNAMLKNAEQRSKLDWAQFGETRRHNSAQEASGREGGGGIFSTIDTGNGMYGLTRNGTIMPLNGPDGKPLVSYHSDTGLRYGMSAAGKGGSAAGTVAEAWPTTSANFGQIYDTLKKFEKPEFKKQASWALGGASVLPNLPGLNTNFNGLRDQLEGQAFLNAFEQLRGAGAITETEGQKGVQAKARMQKAQTVKEFYSALDDFKGVIARSYEAQKTRAQRGAVIPQMAVQDDPTVSAARAEPPAAAPLSASEQAELEALRARFGGKK